MTCPSTGSGPVSSDPGGREPPQRELAEAVARALGGRSLACAESFTAGRLSAALASVERASEWFRGGLVAYQPCVKHALLAVRGERVVSAEAAADMSLGALELFGADVAVATTGVAGSEPVEGRPPGTAFVATSHGVETRVVELHLGGDPDGVCAAGTTWALRCLLDHLALADRPSTAQEVTTHPGQEWDPPG